MKYYNSAVQSVFCATKDASEREDPGTRSGFFLFFFFLVFVSISQKPIRVKICTRAWDPDYAYRENCKH